jgi:tetratricopeptide (TPR) repeat protein
MTKSKHFTRGSIAVLLVAVLLSSGTPPGMACGPWFPRQYLQQGGMSILETPRFFSEIELNTIAHDFPTPFKAVRDEFPWRFTQQRDAADFAAALEAGAIQSEHPDAALLAHRRFREAISQYAGLTPDERRAIPLEMLDEARKGTLPSEFNDYHEGLLEYAVGHHAEARARWERLLARPEAERRYRSVPAAFMIGVLGVVENWDDAPRWFAMARDLTQRGFHDESGLAAASYRRESQWHERRGDLHAAAVCALQSISSGYPAKSCVSPVDDSPQELRKFARDPLLRRIHSSLLLAAGTNPWNEEEPRNPRVEAWLRALEDSGVRDSFGAERIGWICYRAGDYRSAARWLARASKTSPEARWLAGKLAAREGRRDVALREYSTAVRLIARTEADSMELTNVMPDEDTPDCRLDAERAIVAIGAADFRTAFESFLHGGHWDDAAFMAERLVTINELRQIVTRRPWKDEWVEKDSDQAANEGTVPDAGETFRLRWLLGRRLVREGNFPEARPFFPPRWRLALDRYVAALARGNNTKLPAQTRALALWDAAIEARYHGMELMGTEAGPDWFLHGGDFEEDDPVAYRLGRKRIDKDPESDTHKYVPLPVVLKAGAAERARLVASAPDPEKRFHYRYRAAEIAWKATRLLPDNDPRLAAMLNLAGRWLANRDEKEADRFYQSLESHCARTDLGREATKLRWFVGLQPSEIRYRPEALPGDTM